MALRVPESKNSRKQTPQTSPQNPHFDTLGTQIGLYGRGIQHGNGHTDRHLNLLSCLGTVKNTLLSHIVAKIKGSTAIFNSFKIATKTSLICIASTMFYLFSNIVKNIEVDVFFRTSPKNDIVKNWETSHC